MKIKLLETLPIDKKHGAFKGEIFEVLREERRGRGQNGVWCMGRDGAEFLTWNREFEYVE